MTEDHIERPCVVLTGYGQDRHEGPTPPPARNLYRVESTLDGDPNLKLVVDKVMAPNSDLAIAAAGQQLAGVLRPEHGISHFHVVPLDGEEDGHERN